LFEAGTQRFRHARWFVSWWDLVESVSPRPVFTCHGAVWSSPDPDRTVCSIPQTTTQVNTSLHQAGRIRLNPIE